MERQCGLRSYLYNFNVIYIMLLGDDLSYSSDSYPDRWCSNKCKAGEVCAEFVDGELGCVRGNFVLPI